MLAHRLGIGICEAVDGDGFVVRDGQDVKSNPGRLVLIAAVIKIEEDACRNGRRLWSKPDDLVV